MAVGWVLLMRKPTLFEDESHPNHVFLLVLPDTDDMDFLFSRTEKFTNQTLHSYLYHNDVLSSIHFSVVYMVPIDHGHHVYHSLKKKTKKIKIEVFQKTKAIFMHLEKIVLEVVYMFFTIHYNDNGKYFWMKQTLTDYSKSSCLYLRMIMSGIETWEISVDITVFIGVSHIKIWCWF